MNDRGLIGAITDTMAQFTGERIRPHTWVVLQEIKSGNWGIGGDALGLTDVRAIQSDTADGIDGRGDRRPYTDRAILARRDRVGRSARQTASMTPAEADPWGLGLSYGTVRLTRRRRNGPPLRLGSSPRCLRSRIGRQSPSSTSGRRRWSACWPSRSSTSPCSWPPRSNRYTVIAALESLGYEYRGDAGGDGGLVFVLDVRPRVRVAHLHVIAHGDPQWDRYLAFVERLRTDPEAVCRLRRRQATTGYAHPHGRKAYTHSKSDIVHHLVPRARSG